MKEADEERPPVLGTWRNIYGVLVGALILLVIFFYFFTKHFE